MPMLDLENYHRIRDLYVLSIPSTVGEDLTETEYQVAVTAGAAIVAGMSPEAHFIANTVNRLMRSARMTRPEYMALWTMCETFRSEDGPDEYWGRAYAVCLFLTVAQGLHKDLAQAAQAQVNSPGGSGVAS